MKRKEPLTDDVLDEFIAYDKNEMWWKFTNWLQKKRKKKSKKGVQK